MIENRHGLAVILLFTAGTFCSSATAAPEVIYDHMNGGFNSELRFLDLSEPASDIDPDPISWEGISQVGAKLGLEPGTARKVTQVDTELHIWLDRTFDGTVFLQFYQDDAVGGGPGTPIGTEITTPISVDFVDTDPFDGVGLVQEVNFAGFSPIDLSSLTTTDTVWYSLGVRDVTYSGGTGSWYLSAITDQNGTAGNPGNTFFGMWELDPPSGPNPGWHLSDQFGIDFSIQAPNIRLTADDSAVGPLVGDLDGDGFVGIADLNIVLGNWNQNVPPGDPLADPSGDGFVGIEDLNTVLGNWNAGTPPAGGAEIPEPASLALLGLGGLTILHRRNAC